MNRKKDEAFCSSSSIKKIKFADKIFYDYNKIKYVRTNYSVVVKKGCTYFACSTISL